MLVRGGRQPASACRTRNGSSTSRRPCGQRAKRRGPRPRGGGRGSPRPRPRPRARSARRARTARPAPCPPRAAPAARPARTAPAKKSAIRASSSSRPSPVRAETRTASGFAFSSRRRATGSSRSILFSTSSRGDLPRADLVEHLLDRGAARRAPPRRREASATWRIRSPASVSSSVEANASTRPCGSLRMKPTVSVSRTRGRRRRNARVVGSRVSNRRSADDDLGAGERVQQRRLADVGVAGERDGRRLGALAALAHRAPVLRACAAARLAARSGCAPAGGRSRAATRPGRGCRRRRRGARGASTCPRMRGRLYSSWASSTWSLPSAVWACCGEDVEDHRGAVDDPHLERVLERALLARRQLVVADDHLGVDLVRERLQLLELARAEVRARVRARARCCTMRADAGHRRGAQELVHLLELGIAVEARTASTAMTTARSGSASRMM